MFLTVVSAFFGGFLGAVLAGLLFKQDLKLGQTGSILEAGMPRILKRKPEKRTPKALTDLMAYHREIQEQGENRG